MANPELQIQPKPLSRPSARGEFQPAGASPLIEPNSGAVAQSAPAGIPPLATSATLEHVYVATFAIRDKLTGKIVSEVVEVPHTQDPKADQKAAWKVIYARHSTAAPDDIRRAAGRIVSRPGGVLPSIPVRHGETIRQLFPDGSEFEAARTVGTAIFEGALCDIILRHIRAKSVFAVTLRQPGGVVVNFSEQTTTTRLADELPKIIAGILGDESKTMTLYFQKSG